MGRVMRTEVVRPWSVLVPSVYPVPIRPDIYHSLLQRAIFLFESMFYPHRLAIEFSRSTHKFIPHRRAEGRDTRVGPHISHLATSGCSRRRLIFPVVTTHIKRLLNVAWTRIGPYEMERLERSRRRWRANGMLEQRDSILPC